MLANNNGFEMGFPIIFAGFLGILSFLTETFNTTKRTGPMYLQDPYNTAITVAFTTLTTHLSAMTHRKNFPFLLLFIFRYLRLIVHILSFHLLYSPTPVPTYPTYHPSSATVIIPTIDPDNADFAECLTSVLCNKPGAIIIVTVGSTMHARTEKIIMPYQSRYPDTSITVLSTGIANKRRQVCHALPHIKTPITVLVDDHVFWPSTRLLPALLAPFEDPKIGVVGTNKRVRRDPTGLSFRSFWNMIGALYLERHNFEIRATNALDGGVFVISGRTSAHRSSILQDPEFVSGFCDERFFFGLFGPLNADDDNFITRWEVRKGWTIKIQYSDDAMIETTLGTYPKFLAQCLRWARTTWRSNTASLVTDEGSVWWRQPWCVYAVYLSSYVNFALFYDTAMIYALMKTDWFAVYGWDVMEVFVAWMLASKLVKPFSHFWRNPADLMFLPGYVLFGYAHSLVKLYAGLTFWVTAWGGRDLEAVEKEGRFRGNVAQGDESDGAIKKVSGRDWGCESVARVTGKATLKASETPWGKVGGQKRHQNPANLLESKYSWVSTKTKTTMRVPTPPADAMDFGLGHPTPPATEIGGEEEERFTRPKRFWISTAHKRSWNRSEDCERLHDNPWHIGTSGDCLLE